GHAEGGLRAKRVDGGSESTVGVGGGRWLVGVCRWPGGVDDVGDPIGDGGRKEASARQHRRTSVDRPEGIDG
ncbi:MAG: hypothetical protein ACOCP9_05505, partial [Halofilum sp. (in: g-proteobacteria)]